MKIHSFIFFVLLMGISSCTTLPTDFRETNSISLSEVLEGSKILGRPLQESELPEIDVMAVTEEMEQFLEEHVLHSGSLQFRAELLSRALFDEDKLDLFYDAGQTYTAIEAFENKKGNCLAFVFLYTAFAKRAGLDTYFQEVYIIPEWSSVNDEIYVQSRHINVRLELYKIGSYDVDIDRIALNQRIAKKRLSDQHVVGLYYGNIAAEFLLENKSEEAFKYFVKGLKLAPREADLWTNLGVLYKRSGFLDYAERAYFRALELDTRNRSALINLTHLYKQIGNEERAEYYQNISKIYQAKNPYYRYAQAQIAMERFQYRTALKHINYAITRNEVEPSFFELKGQIYKLLGNKRQALKALRTAEQLKAKEV